MIVLTDIVIEDPNGLQNRSATFFSNLVSRFSKNTIWLERGTQCINAKSLLGVLSLKAKAKSKVTLKVDGPDEKAVVEFLAELLQQNFPTEDARQHFMKERLSFIK